MILIKVLRADYRPFDFLDEEFRARILVFLLVVQKNQEHFARGFVDGVVNPPGAGRANLVAGILAAGFEDGQQHPA
jgi:hypothetical protein